MPGVGHSPQSDLEDSLFVDRFTSEDVYTDSEARICGPDPQQLTSGDDSDEEYASASHPRKGRSVGIARKRDGSGRYARAGRNPMGRYPFTVVVNKVLAETDSLYVESTRAERRRKFMRIHKIFQELREAEIVSTTSPKHMTENDVLQFLGWCRAHLDNSTSSKYLRYLCEILQAAGNGSALLVQSKYKRLMPRPTQKPVQTVASDRVERLLGHDWNLEDPFLDALAKAAIALYMHTGLRSGELRNSRLRDLDMCRMEMTVSHPKGLGSWASGKEVSPIMPGVEPYVAIYLEARKGFLERLGYDPEAVEPLFPYLEANGRVAFYEQRMWSKLKKFVTQASGVPFKWKDLRPTFAQMAKDRNVPIEAVSKALRHTSTVTTERYYARIRPETAFSLMRQAWEAPAAEIPKR